MPRRPPTSATSRASQRRAQREAAQAPGGQPCGSCFSIGCSSWASPPAMAGKLLFGRVGPGGSTRQARRPSAVRLREVPAEGVTPSFRRTSRDRPEARAADRRPTGAVHRPPAPCKPLGLCRQPIVNQSALTNSSEGPCDPGNPCAAGPPGGRGRGPVPSAPAELSGHRNRHARSAKWLTSARLLGSFGFARPLVVIQPHGPHRQGECRSS
jgi:hypothetical protein